MLFRVVWEIDIEADSPEEAAAEALKIQRDPESTATDFTVTCCVEVVDADPEDDLL